MRSPCCAPACLFEYPLNYSESTVMKLGMYMTPPGASSVAYFIHPYYQYYQHCNLSLCIVFLTSLRVHTNVSFYLSCEIVKV
jgi:hypothetical protein